MPVPGKGKKGEVDNLDTLTERKRKRERVEEEEERESRGQTNEASGEWHVRPTQVQVPSVGLETGSAKRPRSESTASTHTWHVDVTYI